jgi:hypothetical protein
MILLVLLIRIPYVFAQTTKITDVSYTKTALYDIDTEVTERQLVLNATVGIGFDPGKIVHCMMNPNFGVSSHYWQVTIRDLTSTILLDHLSVCLRVFPGRRHLLLNYATTSLLR